MYPPVAVAKAVPSVPATKQLCTMSDGSTLTANSWFIGGSVTVNVVVPVQLLVSVTVRVYVPERRLVNDGEDCWVVPPSNE